MVDIVIGLIGSALVLAFIAKLFGEGEGEVYKLVFIVGALLMLLNANQAMTLYATNESVNVSGNTTIITSLLENSSGLLIDYLLLIFITLTVLFFLIKILTNIIGNLRKSRHPRPAKPGGS